jgi:anti-sigma regulatory factor (Ser/Thr protein kinase)
MTTPAALRESRFTHELVLHHGPAELIDLMVPFMRDGAAVGDRVVVVGEPRFVHDLLAAAPDVPDVLAVPHVGRERHPGRDLHEFQQLLPTLQEAGSRVRVVNQMPTMTHHQWHAWRRYEAAANFALAPYRVWGTCAYDTDRLDARMLEDLRASHSYVKTSAGRRASDDFARLGDHIRTYLDLPPHPIEQTQPLLSLQNPSPAAARQAIRSVARAFGLTPTATESAVLAVSETVTHGSLHGREPVSLRIWADDGRITVAVNDSGTGPHPLVGLLPVPVDSDSGRGMWILHQVLADLQHRTDRDGYTVRFSVDTPRVAVP